MEELHSEGQQAEPPAPKIIGLTGELVQEKLQLLNLLKNSVFRFIILMTGQKILSMIMKS